MIKRKMYWHSSKSTNSYEICEIEEKHGNFFEDEKAEENFIYTGYEINCDVEVHPDGSVFATHFMGKKLSERVRI